MKVFAIGDNVVDVYVDQRKMYLGGNALNFATMATSFVDIDASYIGNFGDDYLVSYVKQTLAQVSVHFTDCQSLQGSSGFALIRLNAGDRQFLGSNRGGVLRQGIQLNSSALKKVNTSDLVHFNLNGNADEHLSKINGPKVIYDYSDYSSWEQIKKTIQYVDLACFSMGKARDQEVKEFLDKLGTIIPDQTVVLITRGEYGALVSWQGQVFNVGAKRGVKAVDTLGAGDAFITAFSIHLAKLGWGKEGVETALAIARDFSAQQLEVPGSFGHGKEVNENLIQELERKVWKK